MFLKAFHILFTETKKRRAEKKITKNIFSSYHRKIRSAAVATLVKARRQMRVTIGDASSLAFESGRSHLCIYLQR
jgi:hypothetical protein